MANFRPLHGCLGAALPIILMSMNAWSEAVSVSRVTRTFPNALPGKQVTLEKVFDMKTQRLYLRSDHESLQSAAGLFGLEQAEARLIRQKNGALHETLVEKLKDIGEREEILVVVSLRQPDGITYLDKFEHSLEDLKAQSLAIADLKPARSAGTLLNRYAGVRKLVEEDFSAIAWVPKGMLLRMAMDEEIGQISIYEPPQTTSTFFWNVGALFGQSSVDLNVLARSAYSHSQNAIPGGLATNIRAATFESGLNAGFLSCLGVTPAFL